ncbi:outer membrane protein transport protein [Pasteurella oralis]|uniref:Outer membrane protein transport protein n=1 Tax=Pasteurella oralis TaxID=1071947 RepID=A0ABW4NTK4_9PAST
MARTSKFTQTLLSSILAVAAGSASAAAFQLAEVSTSGLGRAYAGEAAIADNAAVVATNPALMTQFKQAEISVGAIFVDTNVNLEGEAALVNPQNPQQIMVKKSADQKNVVPNGLLPTLYFIKPINERFAVGAGMNVNFGMQSKFDSDYSAGIYGGSTKLAAVNLNLSGAYRISQGWSVGLGLNAVHAKAKLERNAGLVSNLYNAAAMQAGVNKKVADDSTIVSRLQDSAWGFGWNAGVVYEFNQNNRFGVAYHSPIDIKFKDSEAYRFNFPKPITGPAELTLNLPAYWEISGYHKMTDKFAMHYSLKRTEWSRFKELRATYTDGSEALHKPENFKDSTRIALGASYDATDALTLRAGIAFDETPLIEPYKSASIPDTDRTWYSLGATYALTPNLSVDVGYTHIRGKESTFVEKENGKPLVVKYTAKSKANLYGLNVNYRF